MWPCFISWSQLCMWLVEIISHLMYVRVWGHSGDWSQANFQTILAPGLLLNDLLNHAVMLVQLIIRYYRATRVPLIYVYLFCGFFFCCTMQFFLEWSLKFQYALTFRRKENQCWYAVHVTCKIQTCDEDLKQWKAFSNFCQHVLGTFIWLCWVQIIHWLKSHLYLLRCVGRS